MLQIFQNHQKHLYEVASKRINIFKIELMCSIKRNQSLRN